MDIAHLNKNTNSLGHLGSPEFIINVSTFLFLSTTALGKCLSSIHFCNLSSVFRCRPRRGRKNPTCSGPVASSAPLSSRIRMKRGKRSEIPLSSTFTRINEVEILSGGNLPGLGRQCTQGSNSNLLSKPPKQSWVQTIYRVWPLRPLHHPGPSLAQVV